MSEGKKRPVGRKSRSGSENQVIPQPKEVKSSESGRWRQVLSLGEQLLAMGQGMSFSYASILAQRDLIVEVAGRLFHGQARLWITKEALPVFGDGLPVETPSEEDLFAPEPPTALMRCAFRTGSLCCGDNPQQDQPFSGTPCAGGRSGHTDSREEGEGASPLVVGAAAAPLLAGQAEPHVLGILQVHCPPGSSLSSLEVDLLEGLAAQSALALQAQWQSATEHWRVEQLSLVRRVSAQIADVRDLDELSRRVTRLIAQTFHYYYVAIFTLEPGEDLLHFRASAGPLRPGIKGGSEVDEVPSPVLSVRLGEGIIGHVVQTGQEILAGDVSRESRYLYLDSLPETRSEFTLPLKIEDRILGALDVQSDQPYDFSETDLLVLRALAGNIAIAVEGARLFSALRRRAEQLAVVSEISNAITSILDLDRLLEEVVNLIQERFGYPFVHLFDVRPARGKIIYQAGSGLRSRALQEQGFAYELDDPNGLIPWVARNGETVLANDVEKEPRYRPSPLPPDNTRAELTVPLIFGGQVLGILDIQSDRQNAFGEEDRFLFEALADNVAIAMRNATLYRSERWRRQVADSLREVAGLLSADVSLDQVLDAILAELDRTLPCDVAAIWLVDEDRLDANPIEDGRPTLRLAAVHRAVSGPEMEVGSSLEEIIASYQPEDSSPPAWLTGALDASQPVIRSAQSPFEPLGSAMGFLSTYSAIAAPLRVGEQTLGVLTLAHHTPERYGAESEAMTAAFASSAAVAIENTRLYEAAHEQAWVSTVLLQVADATQSLNNLNELLATVVHITPMLVGVEACALYMLDDGGAFVPAAASGLDHDQRAEFERWRFAPGEVPAFERLLEDQEPILLYGEAEDQRLANILFSGLQTDQLFESELLVLVPLVAHGEVLGAFLVDYSNDRPESRKLETLEAILDERLAIIQGIAHQTAVAVENLRLLKAQKEEAYISVALLQVAQAVVSSNDLDETLGTIVRLTPILAGVKRSVIYLWDEQEALFYLAASYGIPHDTEKTVFAPSEFPLLDAARERNTLQAYPLSGVDPASENPPDSWTSITPPQLDKIEEHLASEACLLLAIPLSVKEKVQGVMLVEEPDRLPADSFTSIGATTSSYRRLREKRLEIITGISQQAALAIENDHLQREMVERERLEREMQLARQIQRAFLPHQLPELPGWNLSVLWRTAREVGGDFYDVFGLPDNRLGIVIADVADKGMPAALFMTLTRTLVRATVQEIDSPALALTRVNDILVPDAQQGMFVTIFYGVLSPESGQMAYANAGHNPPLLLHTEAGQVERLERSGMALGVAEGNQIEERSVSMGPGDYLVLYTDGATEAFSSDGEMYGEDCLLKTIHKAVSESQPGHDSAEELLEAIDDSVSDFVEDSFLEDDLTLVVLKRLALASRA